MKKIITLMFLGLFTTTTMFGQLSITPNFPNIPVGGTGQVDFVVSGFTDIVSSQFTLNYDPTILQFSSISYTDPAFPGLSAAAFGVPPSTALGTITFSWFDSSLSGVTVADGTIMFSIEFNAIGGDGTNSGITFANSPTPIEFSNDNFQTLPPGDFTLNDSNVTIGNPPVGGGPLGSSFTCPSGATGSNVCIDVEVTDFDLIQGFQYTIEYDPAVLQYTGVSNVNLVDLDPTGNFGNVSPGVLTVSWNDISGGGAGVTLADGTVIYSVCFNVVGAGGTSSAITTSGNSTPIEVTSATSPGTNIGLNSTPCTFVTSGTSGSAVTVSAGSTSGQPGDLVCVDYTVMNFMDIVSLEYVMNYDNSVLQFNSVMNLNPAMTGLSANSFNGAVPGVINFSWFDNTLTGVTLANNDVLYSVCYDIIGVLGDSSPLSYSGNIEASQNMGGATVTVPLTTVPGNVSVVNAPGANFTIVAAEVDSDGATNVCVPFSVLNFSQIVSMQFEMTYDPAHLMYTGVNFPGTLNGLMANNFNLTAPGNLILGGWISPAITMGETLADGTIIYEVCFDKLGAVGTSSVISYNTAAGTEISAIVGGGLAELTNKDFIDGSVTCTTGTAPIDINNTAPVVTQVACFGDADGAIEITVEGGAPTITFLWSNGAVTEDVSGLAPGTYDVTATDGNGNTSVLSPAIIITQPASAISSTNNSTDETAAAANDGTIDLIPTGGTTPYTFSWSNGATTEDLNNLAPGTYTPTITDANGCTHTGSPITINAFTPSPLVVDFGASTTTDVLCFGMDIGAIDLVVSGGTPGYTFAWSNAAATEDVSGLAPGTYTVTITDSGLQTETGTFTINGPTSAVVITETGVTDDNGTNNGAIDITTSGGTPPYTWAWSNGAATEDISSLAGGLYNLTVTDANGCTQMSSHTVMTVIIDPLDVDDTASSFTDVNCAGGNDGTITLVVGGGVMPYNFFWSNGSSTQNLTGLAMGVYTVTVTDATGATDMATFTISAPTSAVTVAEMSVSDTSAPGANDGAVTMMASGGTGPYTYNWSNGFTGATITGLAPGTYCVTATDQGGCTAELCSTVNETMTNPIVLSFVKADPACNGGQGGINLSVSGGTPGYTFLWDDPSMSPFQNLGGIGAGNYCVTVTDAAGAQAFGCESLSEPPAININGTSTVSNGADGTIDITVTGGSPAYQYSWNTGDTTEDLAGLAPGQYCVTIMDANGCSSDACYTVMSGSNPPVLTGGPNGNGLVSSNVSCFGGNDGGIDLTVTGGIAPLTYAWSNGSATEDISGLAAGTYSVTITDAMSDMVSGSITIGGPTSALTTTGMITDETNGSDGAIDLVVAGGTPGYTFSWSPGGQTSEDIGSLTTGTYTVLITDANGCQSTGVYTVGDNTSFPSPQVTIVNQGDAGCNNNGFINISITPGNEPYTYLWTGPNGYTSTVDNISGLAAGNYTVVVTDALGLQTTSQTVTIGGSASSMSVTAANIINESSMGADGQINITVLGGNVPYTYIWSNGATTEDITGLIANCYRVTITDDDGCELVSDDYCVEFSPGAPSVDADVTEISCNGADDGAINVTVVGDGNYTYAWSSGQSSQDINALGDGGYVLTITDTDTGSTYEFTWTLTEPEVIGITLDNLQHLGCPPGPGAVLVSVSGGTFPYTYTWNSGQVTQDLQGVSPGFYELTVTDARGCFAFSDSYEVTDDPPCSLEEMITDVDCAGDFTGAIDVTVVGGTFPYTYAWTGPNGYTSTADDIFNLEAGGYELVVTDANNITNTFNYVVQASSLAGIVSGTTVPSAGSNGSITISISGGIPNFTYLWSGPNGFTATDQNITALAAGTYTVVVTDSNGCTFTGSFEVENTEIGSTIVNEDCAGNNNGSIDISPSGGVPPYTYSWTGPNGFTSADQNIANLFPGTYDVIVTDGNGVTFDGNYIIGTGSNIELNTNLTNGPTTVGASDANATASADGGEPTYTYVWSNGQTGPNLNNVPAGTYTVNVTDGNGCTEDMTIVIEDFMPPVLVSVAIADMTDVSQISCDDICDRSLIADVSGSTAAGPYTYLWSDGQTTQIATGLCDSVLYTVTVTNPDGITGTMAGTPESYEPIMATFELFDSGEDLSDIVITITGGREPYTYVWGNPLSANDDDTAEDVMPGTYSMIVMDASGCTFTVGPIEVFPEDNECLDYRHVITPNGDGFNDNFEFACIEIFPNNELEIYTRWGELVWTAPEGYDNTWEGTDMSGKLLPQGGYFFVFRYDGFDADGVLQRQQLKGAITLLR